MIDWQPIATMPADRMVLLGWQGWPLIMRGLRQTFMQGPGTSNLPDNLLGCLPNQEALPHGTMFSLKAFPPTHWAEINYPTGEQVCYPIDKKTGGWAK